MYNILQKILRELNFQLKKYLVISILYIMCEEGLHVVITKYLKSLKKYPVYRASKFSGKANCLTNKKQRLIEALI